MRILVTGSSGSIAVQLIPRLVAAGHEVTPFDRPQHDVLDRAELIHQATYNDWCIHLAGLKYADRAELEPVDTVAVNVQGTANVVDAFGPQTILTSTCKAADPETVYGASKLIAERIALNAGARVLRFVNVLGSRGSVTEIWDAIPAGRPLPVCDASRLFMSLDQALSMIVGALDWPTGRYAPAQTSRRAMADLAYELHRGREIEMIPLRRGDRRRERLLAACERSSPFRDGVIRIHGQHDPDSWSRALAGAVAA